MSTINVGCAIILKQGKILIAQRKPGTFLSGYWEFPGGKCEAGESMEDCLIREVAEELGVLVSPRQIFCRADHEYPHKTVSLHFYFCDWVSGNPVRHDCLDFRWVTPEELRSVRMIPADIEIIGELLRKKQSVILRPKAEES